LNNNSFLGNLNYNSEPKETLLLINSLTNNRKSVGNNVRWSVSIIFHFILILFFTNVKEDSYLIILSLWNIS